MNSRRETGCDDGMFHVEQRLVRSWARSAGVSLPGSAPELMSRYAAMVIEANERHNLTGCSTLSEAVQTLVLGSLEPLTRLDVPRGTRYADIGSGSGVPGVPLALARPEASGVLVEAQAKRAEFIVRVIEDLRIPDLTVECGRVEDLARTARLRESFDAVFSRAFGPVYVVLEMGLPLLKVGGWLYIYSKRRGGDLICGISDHATELGGRVRPDGPGIVVEKVRETPEAYPRRYPAIKREAQRLGREWIDET